MPANLERMLRQYAELTVRVGLNLQPGQRLLIGDPIFNYGVPLLAAPLVQQIATCAYRAGARFVDVIWGDERLHQVRFRHAPRDSFAEFPTWQAQAMLDYARRGDAHLTILANDPDLLSDQDAALVATLHKTGREQFHPAMDYVTRRAINWCVIAAATPGWAARVFPDLPRREQIARLWQAIFAVCRLDRPDPVAAWQNHVRDLASRCDYLSAKQYHALKLTAPGTDLTIGLPRGHCWTSGRLTSTAGIAFTCDLPTEEIFTLPHKDQVEGVVTATRSLSFGGTRIENFRLTFAGGRVVNATAGKGETALRKLLETDEGASQLGEIALVPHSSPIAQSGLLFYNVLIDENAASHLALGQAYRFTLEGGESLSDDEFAAAGGNRSISHVDFMIGCGEMNVDGVTDDGATEPVMRAGEWAFDAR